MARILIVYYSRTGNTKAMAEAVAEGARQDGAEVVIKPVQECKAEELLDADGIIIGSPTYYGLMSAEIKQLLDDSVKFHGQLAGKVGAAFASSANVGGGNETTILAILQALLIHGMVVQGDSKGDHYGPVAIGSPDDRATSQCRTLGAKANSLARRLFG